MMFMTRFAKNHSFIGTTLNIRETNDVWTKYKNEKKQRCAKGQRIHTQIN